MVTIRKGSIIRTCTKGAFDSIFKPQGWKRVEEEINSSTPLPEVAPEEDESLETPLSEMTIGELREYAHKQGIDISGAKKKKDIRDIIQNQKEG